MEFELNDLFLEIYSWKALLKRKDEEIESLQKQLLHLNKQNETLETSHKILLYELSELNNAVSVLRDSFQRIEDFEAERKHLFEEKKKLKNSLESLEKLYKEEKEKTNKELEKIKSQHEIETAKLVSEIRSEATKKFEAIETEISEKEDHIKELKEVLSKLKNEKDQDILKIKVQYEEKIGKLKQQLPKSRGQTVHGLQTHDIFRQKYHKLERESAEEISKLKEQVKSLQLLSESLKHKNESSSLSSLLLTTAKPNACVQAKTSAGKNENDPVLKQVQNGANRMKQDYFLLKKGTLTKTELVQPQKRKLFNLNDNYFIK